MRKTLTPISKAGTAFAALALASLSSSQASPTLPFKVDLVEVPNSKMPPLHSFSVATSGGKWLVFGGRTAGLHGFAPSPNNFPRSTANTTVYVLDPAANQILGAATLTSLPPQLASSLTATNQQSVQVGESLYVVGGYGKKLPTGANETIGSLIRIDVPGLMAAIVAKKPIASYFVQSVNQDQRLKVSGGDLTYSYVQPPPGGTPSLIFYLVFGQDFDGDYSVQNYDYNHAGGQFQKYTEKVRAFTVKNDTSNRPLIDQYYEFDGGYDANLPYHRRDLNVTDVLDSNGMPMAVAYGGVFLAGKVGGHRNPIEITYGTTVGNASAKVINGFDQGLNHYDCARMSVFDKASSSCFTTFFGGISQYHYDPQAHKLIQDQVDLHNGVDGLPFINSISTIERGPNSSYSQFIQPTSLPYLLGTDTRFVPSQKLVKNTQISSNGVVKLSGLSGRTLVGYLYGGIESKGPYSGLVKVAPPGTATTASRRLFKVYVTPGQTAVTAMPPIPTATTPYPPK